MTVGKTETREVKPLVPKRLRLKAAELGLSASEVPALKSVTGMVVPQRCSIHDGSFFSSLSQKQFASVCQDELGYAAVTDSPQNIRGLKLKPRFLSSALHVC